MKKTYVLYDPSENKLRAFAETPIEIINKYLGYHISWELMEFSIRLKDRKSLSSSNIDTILIVGTASFKDISNTFYYKKITLERRQQMYDFSERRFFKLLVENKIDDSNFHLFENKDLRKPPYKADRWFRIEKDSLDEHFKCVHINPNERDSLGVAGLIVTTTAPIKGFKNLLTSSLSWIFFFTDQFKVDAYGNTNLMKNYFIRGDMARYRIGGLLPLDYSELSE
jgi:hypothetical protein